MLPVGNPCNVLLKNLLAFCYVCSMTSGAPKSIEEMFQNAPRPQEHEKYVQSIFSEIEDFLLNKVVSAHPCKIITTERKGNRLYGQFFEMLAKRGHSIYTLKGYQSSKLALLSGPLDEGSTDIEVILLVDSIRFGNEVESTLKMRFPKFPELSKIKKVCAYISEKTSFERLVKTYQDINFCSQYVLDKAEADRKCKDLIYISHAKLEHFDDSDHAWKMVKISPQIPVTEFNNLLKEIASSLPVNGVLDPREDKLSSLLDGYTLEWTDPRVNLTDFGMPQKEHIIEMLERVQIRIKVKQENQTTYVQIMAFAPPLLGLEQATQDQQFLNEVWDDTYPEGTLNNVLPELVEKNISQKLIDFVIEKIVEKIKEKHKVSVM